MTEKPPAPDPRKDPPPVFDKSTNTMSKHALRLAEELGLPVVFRWPLDMADPNHVARFVAEFGEDALPEDQFGMYYVYYLISEVGERVPLVKGEGEVHTAMVDLAVRIGGQELAKRFAYRWSLFARR
jgi:hypothetical protein